MEQLGAKGYILTRFMADNTMYQQQTKAAKKDPTLETKIPKLPTGSLFPDDENSEKTLSHLKRRFEVMESSRPDETARNQTCATQRSAQKRRYPVVRAGKKKKPRLHTLQQSIFGFNNLK